SDLRVPRRDRAATRPDRRRWRRGGRGSRAAGGLRGIAAARGRDAAAGGAGRGRVDPRRSGGSGEAGLRERGARLAGAGGRGAACESVRRAEGPEEALAARTTEASNPLPPGGKRRPARATRSFPEQSHGCPEVPRFPLPPWPASCPRFADRQAAVDRPDLGRDPSAPPRHRRRLLPRQAGDRAQGAGRRGRLILASRARPGPARFAALPAWPWRAARPPVRRPGPREGSTDMSEQASNHRIYSRIAGTGSYLPEKVLTNDDL